MGSYRAKIKVNDEGLVFEINDALEVNDAVNFAKKSVASWLDSHEEHFDKDIKAKVVMGDNEIDLKLQ